jgi:short-subunit dehydrogenase
VRQQRSGGIINISSNAGKLSTLVNGIYSASKFGLEALSDALRHELSPFGIRVIVIELGAIKTHFDDTAQAPTRDILSNPNSPYRPLYQKGDESAEFMRQRQSGSAIVSQTIQQTIESSNPTARCLVAVPLPGRLVLYLRGLVWGIALGRMFKFVISER